MPNLKTDIKFVVHSDLNNELVYAEFDSKKAAIRYARDYSNEFTYVDKVECFLDPETGRIDEIISSTTVWSYLDESVEPENVKSEDEDYWDMMVANYEEEEANKHDLGDTTWFESMDNLVETLEESEDTVECKECFELFPKVDCIKLDVGYVCPTCAHCEVADADTFKIEFPEYEKFRDTGDEFDDSKLAMSDEDVARVNEPFEEPFNSDTSREGESEPELTAEEVVPFLVKDEVEAVAGYEKAAEVVVDSDLENKEEILDTIDHIKEEEEEHIEELQDLVDDEIVEVENDPSSTEEVEETEKPKEELVEHINDRDPAIESDQELEGTDNAVVDCKVADVVSHSEDEKPVDCEGKKKPLEKPLTEGFTFSLNNEKDLTEFTQLCQEVGIKTIDDLDRFTKETAGEPGNILDKLRSYRKELGDDFEIKEELNLQYGQSQIKSIATFVHTAVNNLTKDNRVGTRQDGTSFYVLSDKRSANPEQIKKTIVDTLAKNGYDPEVVQYVDKGQVYGFVVDKIRATSRVSLKYENLTGGVKFTEEEQEEFNMDEDGNSLDSYDTYVRCGWCDEIFTKDQCVFEANLGWLCDRCQSAITSRGERLTLITNPTEEDIAKTLTEEVELTKQELKDKFGTDDVDLINAGREEADRVVIKEDSDVDLKIKKEVATNKFLRIDSEQLIDERNRYVAKTGRCPICGGFVTDMICDYCGNTYRQNGGKSQRLIDAALLKSIEKIDPSFKSLSLDDKAEYLYNAFYLGKGVVGIPKGSETGNSIIKNADLENSKNKRLGISTYNAAGDNVRQAIQQIKADLLLANKRESELDDALAKIKPEDYLNKNIIQVFTENGLTI